MSLPSLSRFQLAALLRDRVIADWKIDPALKASPIGTAGSLDALVVDALPLLLRRTGEPSWNFRCPQAPAPVIEALTRHAEALQRQYDAD